jgi:hypothetical protein
MRRAACVTACALWGGWAGAARAQAAPAPVSCNGQRIDAINIISRAPTVAGVRRIPVLAQIAQTVHTTTQPEVISRFLLLHVGDRCSERRRAESAHILRAQPFLADASITVIAGDAGGVTLNVETIDEIAAVFSATLKARAPVVTGLRVGDANAGGEGIYVAGRWWQEQGLRDGYALGVTDYQALGQPYQATARVARNPLGGEYHFGVQLPFLTDLQRVAWRVQRGRSDDYVRFVDASGMTHADLLSRDYEDAGGLARIGPPGRLALVGLSISHETAYAGTAPILISANGTSPDSAFPLDARYASHTTSRLNALVGYRNLRYVSTTGFEGLRDVADVPEGIEIGALIGKSPPFLGSRDHDMLVGAEVYAGRAGSVSSVQLQADAEARRPDAGAAWDGLLTSGRLAWHERANASQMFVTSLEWGGGWHVRVPFRVSLAGTEGGIRGMSEGLEQGGRRAVLRLEDRLLLSSPGAGVADLGVAFFVDAGRLWAGDVPYGRTTPLRYSTGISLLAAVPSHSARLWRLDLALASRPGRGPRFAVRLSHNDQLIGFWQEPHDVAMARERSVPASLFNWP